MHQAINPSSHPSTRPFINQNIQPYSHLSKHPFCRSNIYPYSQPSVQPSIHNPTIQPAINQTFPLSIHSSYNKWIRYLSTCPSFDQFITQTSYFPASQPYLYSTLDLFKPSNHPISSPDSHLSFNCLSSVPTIQLIIRPSIHQPVHARVHSSLGTALHPVHSIVFDLILINFYVF